MRPTTTSSIVGGSCEVKRSTQVNSYLADTQRALAGLEEALGIHANAIGPILRGAIPQNQCDKAAPAEDLCPVADALCSISRNINRLRDGLQNLTERTEA